MRNLIGAAVAAGGVWLAAGAADASVFAGYSETSDVFFDGGATFDYDPVLLGVSILNTTSSVDILLSTDLSIGSLTLYDAALAGDLIDTLLESDGAAASDSFSMLFELAPGTTYAIATFIGDLDTSGATSFFADGVRFQPGTLRIVGATKDIGVVPLPAGFLLLGTVLVGLGLLGARQPS